MTDLENRLWQLETTINVTQNPDYRSCKEKLDKRHEKKVNVLRIRDNNKKIWLVWALGKSDLSSPVVFPKMYLLERGWGTGGFLWFLILS